MKNLVIPRWGLWLMFVSSLIGGFLLGIQLLAGKAH